MFVMDKSEGQQDNRRRKIRWYILLVVLVAVGASSCVIESIVTKKNASDDTIVYASMGDSIAEGHYASTLATTFPAVFASLVEENYHEKVEIHHYAKYGRTSSFGVGQIDRVRQLKPDVITIEFGTNDANPVNGSDVDQFAQNMRTMLNELSYIDGLTPQIVLVTTWNHGKASEPFDTVVKNLGKEYNLPVADIKSVWDKDPEKTAGPPGLKTFNGTSDRWHPNDEGMKQIGEIIYQAYQSKYRQPSETVDNQKKD